MNTQEKPAKKATKKSSKGVAPARAIRSGGVSYAAPDMAAAIHDECDELAERLIAKNAAYGNSALDPVRIFSRASTEEQLLVRIDDKLSRLVRGTDAGEDVIQDLLGYLVLLRIARTLTPIPFAVAGGAK